MSKRMIAPLVFGIAGCAILIGLGVWQVKRLVWKEAMLARIEAQIAAQPVPVFAGPLAEFQSVAAEGRITDAEIHVLTSIKGQGAGFRVVAAFETGGRRILLDRGFVPQRQKNAARPPVTARIAGNFRTVDEADGFTPDPDLDGNYWYARDVPAMAAALGAEPVLIILRETSETDPPVTPMPVTTAAIPNDHLVYAITWFALAAVWAGMTGFLLWRIRQRTD